MSGDTAGFAELLARAQTRAGPGPCGRYAPSPTGPLHRGNLRTALVAWLQARLAGARFVLRMEDLDRPRVRRGSAARIIEDLRWLGLDWDEGPDTGGPLGPYRQSRRQALYAAALACLRAAERVFPCLCSRADIRNAASAPHGAEGPVYPGTCRGQAAGVVERRGRARGREPAWRFRVDDRVIECADEIAAPLSQNLCRDVGDFVVRRADALFAYQLAVVVDDALMGVTDVVRGADLLPSTPRQTALFRALGAPLPRFWHVPLLRDAEGRRMAKRDGADSVAAYRARGGSSPRLTAELAASLGLAPAGVELTAQELLRSLDAAGLRQALRAQAAADPATPPSAA